MLRRWWSPAASARGVFLKPSLAPSQEYFRQGQSRCIAVVLVPARCDPTAPAAPEKLAAGAAAGPDPEHSQVRITGRSRHPERNAECLLIWKQLLVYPPPW